jgi:hypothetical protein
VDNLNQMFLYPELSKQADLLSSLMRSLSRHLRPAPYPYGLLTLRLLGKLDGKNRQFLRDSIHSVVCGSSNLFFDAEPTTSIGNIRLHMISLLFRSLVSTPGEAVVASHNALRDVLSLSAKATRGCRSRCFAVYLSCCLC